MWRPDNIPRSAQGAAKIDPVRDPQPRARRVLLLDAGCRLMAEGRFFQAHEAFEDLWNSTDSRAERDVWQGMVQVAAALVKHDRGEPSTAITLLAKAKRRLEGTPLLRPHAAEMKAWLDGLAGPVTQEAEIPSSAVPPPVAEALSGLLGSGEPEGDAPGGAAAEGDASRGPLS